MNFSIVFQNSGDYIPFQTINSDIDSVLSYYVENLNTQNVNKFSTCTNIGKTVADSVNKLHSTITECNKFAHELLEHNIDTYTLEEYLDQRILNKLHADWVHSHAIEYNIIEKRNKYKSKQADRIHNMYPDDIPTPIIGDVIKKLKVEDLYNTINLDLHVLENIFNKMQFRVLDVEWFNIVNPFSKLLINNDLCNFRISFTHLGRTLYDKFTNFDYNLEFDDENTFDQLLGFVEMSFVPPQTIPLSKEYVRWCKQHNKVPSGNFLNIGNIPDLNNSLTKYRKIIFQNTLQNNFFSIQLNKGN